MKPNILFILLDGARWDRMDISPEIKELKSEGTTFTNISSAIPYTFGAMNVIFTGLYGKENGVDAYYKMFRLKDSVDFLPELLNKNGYFTCSSLISDKVISSRGFDIHESYDEHKVDPSEYHIEFLKNCFNKAKDKPVFAFLQFSKIHTSTVTEVLKKYEWNDKKFYENKKENLKIYDQAFLEAGIYAKQISEYIKNLNKSNETFLIFFTDHGTGVGERFGERNYGVFLYEETIRTSFIFIGPKILKNKEYDKLLGSINLMPTLLELCGIESINSLQGKSFAKLLFDSSNLIEDEFTFSETGGLQGPHPSPMEPNVFCIKNRQHKLIYFKTSEEWKLFDLQNDPKELDNKYGSDLEIEEKFKQTLLSWIDR